MPITVIVRDKAGEAARLTFDGTQRVVIGRGPGSDVRLPDPSVSHRHASLRAQGADFAVVDEGSTNGTFVGAVKIAPRTSRIVRSGDLVRIGAVWLELRIDRDPVTRDVAAATRDLALALVSQAMAAMGADPTPNVRVVEGRDQGAAVSLTEEGRAYVIGRAPQSDLVLDDADCSREHLHVLRRTGAVFLRDLAAKNGTYLGEERIAADKEVAWRQANMVRIGRTVLALEDPIADALAEMERAPDQPMGEEVASAPPTHSQDSSVSVANASKTPIAAVALDRAPRPRPLQRPGRWSVADMLVMAAAVSVLALSLVGLVWLLRG